MTQDRPRATPLASLVEGKSAPARTTPLDVLALARKKWLAGERLDLGRIANELGIGRATVFRWVGTRENLYGEVCSALFARDLERAQDKARGTGVARLVDILDHLLHSLASAAPLRRFVAEDPELAMRVLTSRESPVQHRCTLAVQALIDELVPEPALPPAELAYIVVRITESFLYRDVITGDEADIDAAIRAIRLLLVATPEKKKRAAR